MNYFEYCHHNHNTPANYSNWFKGGWREKLKKNSEEGPTSLQKPKGLSRAWPLAKTYYLSAHMQVRILKTYNPPAS